MNHTNQTIMNQLNNLLSIIEASKESYQHATHRISDPTLKEEFQTFYQERHEYSVQLQQQILKYDGIPDNEGIEVDEMTAVKAEIKSSLDSSDRFTLMNICVSIEEITIEEYKKVIENPETPIKVKDVLSQQLDGIERTFLFLVAQFV